MSSELDRFNSFMNPETKIYYLEKNKKLEELFTALNNREVEQFEHPDMYLQDEKRVYLIEHFEVDNYATMTAKNGKNIGSQSKIEEKRIERVIDSIQAQGPVSFNEQIHGTSTPSSLHENVEKTLISIMSK